MAAMKYGYARVSTDGQSVDAQVRQLTRSGCRKVVREVASGAKADRRQLRRMLDQFEAGDVLVVTRLDRLAAPRAICSTRWQPSPIKGRPFGL
jgi:DNA invertase Pin-like site-specific DNA recombinase